MKRILTTTAMVAMTAGSAFAFDVNATDTALETEAATANTAITAAGAKVTFVRFDGTNQDFEADFTGVTDAVSAAIEDTDVVKYTFAKAADDISFSLNAGVEAIAATPTNIKSAIDVVNADVRTMFYGADTAITDVEVDSTVGIVGEMVVAMVADVADLNQYALDNRITGPGALWSTFEGYAGNVTNNFTKLNDTIGLVETALTATTTTEVAP